jgi:hypothetical protein
MKADRVSLHSAQNRTHSGPPWALWRKEFCLAACLAERHVQGRMRGTTARHGTRVIVGRRCFLSPPPQVRFRGEADIIRQARPAELVENDPGCVKTCAHEKRAELFSGPAAGFVVQLVPVEAFAPWVESSEFGADAGCRR